MTDKVTMLTAKITAPVQQKFDGLPLDEETGASSVSSRSTRRWKVNELSETKLEAIAFVGMDAEAICLFIVWRLSFTSASAISNGSEIRTAATSSQIISTSVARQLTINRESGKANEL